MLKKDVEIGAVYYTRIGAGKGRVKVLRIRTRNMLGSHKIKTLFVCLNLATQREIERGARALHLTEDFYADEKTKARRVQRTEVSSLDVKSLAAGEGTSRERDLTGDPGHDMAERRETPPPKQEDFWGDNPPEDCDMPESHPEGCSCIRPPESVRDTLPDTVDYSFYYVRSPRPPDPGHDMAERREIPPPPDAVTGEDTLPDTLDYSDPCYYDPRDVR
jgi:hypothetical protein